MAKTRRSPEEIAKLVAKVDELIAGGKTVEAATNEVGISRSIIDRRNEKKKESGGVKGSVKADSLPPRPKKHGGKRPPKKVDMDDLGSVAMRIAKLDKKLRDIDGLVRERIFMVAQLVKLLKVKKT